MSNPESNPNSKRTAGVILIIIGALLPPMAFLLAETPCETFDIDSKHEREAGSGLSRSGRSPRYGDYRKAPGRERTLHWEISHMQLLYIPLPVFMIFGLALLGTGTGLVLLNPHKPEPPPEPPKES